MIEFDDLDTLDLAVITNSQDEFQEDSFKKRILAVIDGSDL